MSATSAQAWGDDAVASTERTPRYKRFRLTYPTGTVIDSHYAAGATLEQVQATHPLATVCAVEESRL